MDKHTELPLERVQMTDDDHTGVCPKCGKCDGYFNVGREHWMVCHRHMLTWCAGANMPAFIRDGDTKDDWNRNAEILMRYTEVVSGDGGHPQVPLEVGWAINVVLDQLWSTTAAEYSVTPPEKKDWHLFRHLYVLDRWLNGESHDLPPRWTPNFLEQD